ncbi:MAG: hypothetical protein ACI920_000740 [Saprospiraceae bacterium]|jgi:hypothetical protein
MFGKSIAFVAGLMKQNSIPKSVHKMMFPKKSKMLKPTNGRKRENKGKRNCLVTVKK